MLHPESESRPETRELTFSGIHVEGIEPIERRSSEHVLFVPGFGLTAESGLPIARSFAETGLPGYSVDLRGRGKSVHDENFFRTTLTDYIADIGTATEGLERERGLRTGEQILVGFSAGGLIAAQRSIEHPPKGLILLSPTIAIDAKPFIAELPTEVIARRQAATKVVEELIKQGQPYDKGKILDFFRGRVFPADREAELSRLVDQESPAFILERYRGVDMPRELRVPTLVAGIDGDQAILATMSRRVAEYLQGADYIEGKGSHMIMFEQGWQDLFRQIREWIEAKVMRTSE